MSYRSLSLHSFWDFFGSPVRRAALDGMSIELAPGETAAVVGRNGAGKTTLIKIFAGLILPSEGEVFVGGADMLREPLAAKRMLGYMSPQERSFYWRLTARRNMEFFGALYGMNAGGVRARAAELAPALGLEDADMDAPFRSLSTGTQQRMGLMRALLHRPRLLLLDEPTRSLDAAAAASFLDLIAAMSRLEGMAVLYATHIARELRFAARIHVMRRGRESWSGTPEEMEKAGAAQGRPPSEAMEAGLLSFLEKDSAGGAAA
jgi:ABC-2 type transport system ATP-binding protein